MVDYFRISVTFIVTAASLVFMVPAACSSPVSPRNISQAEQTGEIMDPGDCLPNQFFSPNLSSCEDCTFCTQGTEHSPKGQCGNGWGVETTCTPCAEGFFQVQEGYTGLVCSRCVTCDLNVEYLQNCTPTQDARCGPCPPGQYYFLLNICLECEQEPSHPDCPQPISTIKPSTASSNQSAPTLPSLITLPNSTAPAYTSTPSPAHNTIIDHDEHGTPTTKFTWYSGVIVVCTIVICVILLFSLALYKKWKAGNNLATGHVLPSKSPDGESGQLIPSPAIDVATPGPAVVTPAPAVVTPAHAVVTPAPAIVTPAPAVVTPAPAPVSDLLQGASNPGDQLAASLPTDVSNTETSEPRALCSDGGPVGDHDAWYQNQQNHDPGSPDSAKVNFVFENDDGSVLSLPMPLMSNE